MRTKTEKKTTKYTSGGGRGAVLFGEVAELKWLINEN